MAQAKKNNNKTFSLVTFSIDVLAHATVALLYRITTAPKTYSG